MNIDKDTVPLSELHKFVVNYMVRKGASEEHASVLADSLVMADYRGHYSHGVANTGLYGHHLTLGTTCGGGKSPTIIKETVATALVDGNDLLGAVVGKYCMELAMKKAKATGIGMVTNTGSNHFGFAGWYTMMATENKLLGFAFTNTSPTVKYTGTNTRTSGTNPISFAAPGKEGSDFVLDMATSVVCLGKTKVQKLKGEEIPSEWAVDEAFKETNDPDKVYALNPLGGSEETSGYKGSGLALMVEILCSVLGGSKPTPMSRIWGTYDTPADVAHCFIAVDPAVFADGFCSRLDFLLNFYRNLPTTDKNKKSMVAGDPEKNHMDLCDRIGGVPFDSSQLRLLNELSKEAGIPSVETRDAEC